MRQWQLNGSSYYRGNDGKCSFVKMINKKSESCLANLTKKLDHMNEDQIDRFKEKHDEFFKKIKKYSEKSKRKHLKTTVNTKPRIWTKTRQELKNYSAINNYR